MMNYFDPFTRDFWEPLGMAIVCGSIVGLERQLRGKPMGVRTSILICLSTSVFIHLGNMAAGANGDPARVLSQVVTGVGFLGAGVMLSRGGTVTGVTTAAVIWSLAAIGAAIGLGYPLGALALSLITVAVLVGVELLESSLRWLRKGVHEEKRVALPPEE